MSKKVESVEARLGNIETELRRIRSLYERTMSYKVNDPETAMMHARKAAEAICRQIFLREYGASPGNLTLDQLIEKLNARNALPRAINVPMRTIQGYGNFAAHEQDGNTSEAITPEYIQPCLQALATVVDWYFGEQTKLPVDVAEVGISEGAAGGLPPASLRTEHQAPDPIAVGITGVGGATRVGDLARQMGVSDAAVMRLARETLSLELRTPLILPRSRGQFHYAAIFSS